MSDESLVLGLLDDLEEGIRYAKLNDFGEAFVAKFQGVHDGLVDISNRLEEEDDVSRLDETVPDLVEKCFIKCREGNKEEAERVLGNLKNHLKKV